jgi:hypothetical protein
VVVVLLVGCGKLAPKERFRPANAAGTGGTDAAIGASAGEGQSGDASNEPTAGTGGGGTPSGGSGGRSDGGSSAGPSSGGASATAGVAGGGRTGSAGGRGGAAMSPYEPTNMDVPPEGDGTLTGGSVEGNLGTGWDLCGSNHPGLDLAPTNDQASDGARFLMFDSTLPCPGCASTTSDMQVSFWFDTLFPAGETRYLYFDVADFGPKRPTGTLLFGSTITPCSTAEVLASIPLEELDITHEWQTRCVAITPHAAFVDFGLYVADGTFKIGIDALRFGPPCR